MKKNKRICAILATLALFLCFSGSLEFCAVKERVFKQVEAQETNANGSLEEITKPYLGVYECKSLYFGGVDKKKIFEFFRVELKSKGELLLTYKLKRGEVHQIPLNYEYDFAEKMLWVQGEWGVLKVDKKFPMKNGEISVAMSIFGKLAVLKFARS